MMERRVYLQTASTRSAAPAAAAASPAADATVPSAKDKVKEYTKKLYTVPTCLQLRCDDGRVTLSCHEGR